jgi:pimeloyl-ACP methyl ester carboxylesterase
MLRRLHEGFQRLTASISTWFQERKLSQRSVRHKVPEIARMLQNEDWTQLRCQFPLILRWFLTEAFLCKGFQAISFATGPIVHVGEPVVSTGWFLTSAKLPIEFQRAKLGMSILLSPSGMLLSLGFSPQNVLGLGPSWKPPSYALNSSSHETEVQVGTREMRSPGTLTLPASPGQHPCLVMLPGSGPCDQDSSVGCTKPFKDLALGLATLGVATLRFEKITRTHGAKVKKSKSFTLETEYMTHAFDAIHQAFEHNSIAPAGVYVLGHSLGAYVAPHLMASDPRIAGCIIMAGPATPTPWSALRQYRYLASFDPDKSVNINDLPQIKDFQRQCELSATPDLSLSTPASKLPFGMGAAYWRDFANFTPIETCAREQRPVFILQGARDYQVTLEDDFAKWRSGLGQSQHARLEVYPDLNHLFISGEGKSTPREYDEPGNVDERVVRDIAHWVS